MIGESRFQTSPRGYLLLVLAFALFCGQMAWLRNQLNAWEAQRVRMYLQRDVTKAVMEEWKADLGLADVAAPMSDDPMRTPTAEWSENILNVGADGWKPTTRRVRASGFLNSFNPFNPFSRSVLEPITVEVYDPRFLDGPWLARLLREYDERGWRSRVVKPPEASLASPPPFRSPF